MFQSDCLDTRCHFVLTDGGPLGTCSAPATPECRSIRSTQGRESFNVSPALKDMQVCNLVFGSDACGQLTRGDYTPGRSKCHRMLGCVFGWRLGQKVLCRTNNLTQADDPDDTMEKLRDWMVKVVDKQNSTPKRPRLCSAQQ